MPLFKKIIKGNYIAKTAAILFVIFITYSLYFKNREMRALEENGTETIGEIVEYNDDGRRQIVYYTFSLEKKTITGSSTIYYSLSCHNKCTGLKCKIRYVEGNPTINEFVEVIYEE